MTSRWRFLLACGCVLAAAVGSEPRAQTPGEGAAPAAPATPQTEEQKVPWWGGRFALYLETGVGGASSDDVNASVETTLRQVTYSTFDPGDRSYGRVVVGWLLPLNRGMFQFRYTAYKEDGGWELSGQGAASFVSGSNHQPDSLLPWWTYRMTEGQIVASRNPPVWNNVDGDSDIDPAEVVYAGVDQSTIATAPDTLQQRSRSYDLVYQREFADKGPTDRWTGRWSTGLRHYELEGAVPMGAWLGLSSNPAVDGDPGLFSEGALLRPILMRQDTKGNGPTGTLELQFHFLRRRATAYAQSRAAFLLQNLSADSGLAYTLTRYPIGTNPTTVAFYPTPMQLVHDVDKTAWQVGAEVGLRFRILPGFDATAEYHTESQQDVLLVPDRVSIPSTNEEAQFGTNAIFTTKDIDHEGWSVGLSFQF
jgi:hypothetical protein